MLPLYKQIIHDILQKIFDGSLRPGDRIPSEHDLCSNYMVSSITAKNALAELTSKGYIIRQKGKGSFVNSLENLMQIPDFSNTVSHRNIFQSKTIGLIVPSMKTGIDQQLLNCIEKEISQTDYLMTLVITREDQRQETNAIQKLKTQGTSGLIIFPTEHELYNEAILQLSLEKYPFVLVDRYLKGIRTNTVCINNYEVTKQAISYLLDKHCKNIVFISPDSRNTVTEERLSSFKDTLLENNINISTHNICMIPIDLTKADMKRNKITRFLLSDPTIDGIFCANREMASYVCDILNEQDSWNRYHICAFDYMEHARVSYIQQDVSTIAHECSTILLENIQGNTVPRQIRVAATFYGV